MMPLIKKTTATLRYIFSLHTLVGLLVMILLSALLSTSSSAQARKVTDPQLKERKLRALNANEQLKRYYQRAKSDLLKEKPGLNGVPVNSRVQIKLNAARQTSSTIFFYDDMEGGTNGWTTELIGGSTDDLWHQTTRDAGSPTHSWWCGIELQGDYHTGNRINTALKSPAINLTTAVAPVKMLFTENFVTEQGWDFCMVEVSTDGGTTWTQLRGGYGSAPNGDSDGWDISTLDLSTYAGSTINLRFHFDTGDTLFNDFPGWYVDDVVIFDQSGTITGKKFFDLNNNGAKDIGERGVKDWFITAAGPVSLTTRTNYRGKYTLQLPLGTYSVTEAAKVGWTPTFPDTGDYFIVLSTPDTLVDSVWFGNYTSASFINGIKFHDLNQSNTYDGGDTLLPEWRINLYDTNGVLVDYDRTDSIGEYSLYVFQPGTYIVREDERNAWLQTFPDTSEYFVEISNLSTTVTNKDFGNYFTPSPPNSIIGQKFNDLNKNGVKDDHEPGLAGWVIKLQGPKNKQKLTDSLGYYAFYNLPAGLYTISEIAQPGWCQSYPVSGTWSAALSGGSNLTDIDFGNYEVPSGSINGTVWIDANGNAIQDSGEVGKSGFRIDLSGATSGTAYSDGSGHYEFTGLWKGSYILSQVARQGWVQTYPVSFGAHAVNLACEENRIGVDFGDIDSVYTGTYRSFTAESLALGKNKKGKHKPIPYIADKYEFKFLFMNYTGDSVGQLTIKLSLPPTPGTVTITKPDSFEIIGAKLKTIHVIFDPYLQAGDGIEVRGFVGKPKEVFVNKWFWTFANDSTTSGTLTSWLEGYRPPMPNTINVIELAGNGLKIGLGGAHTVKHSTWKDVVKSLVEKNDRMHIGDPRCLKLLANRKEMKKELKYLPPSKGQNKLFAKAIAFKMNIVASQINVTPPGFGNLIFDDGTGALNPLNNLSLTQIANKIDSFMTLCNDIPGVDDSLLYDSTLAMINAAFSGPMDTIGFGGGLKVKGVYPLSAIDFLRYDTAAIVPRTSPIVASPAIPELYQLYQNYPNPFNPSTTIQFYLPEQSYVTLKIYNALGQVVAELLHKELMDDGTQEVEFPAEGGDASSLASGVYYYRLVAESIVDEDGSGSQTFTSVRKMILLK